MKHKYILACALSMIGIATQAQDDVRYDISATPATELVEGHEYLLQNRAYQDISIYYLEESKILIWSSNEMDKLGSCVSSYPYTFCATDDGFTVPITLGNINEYLGWGYGDASGGLVLSPRRSEASSAEPVYFTITDADDQYVMLYKNTNNDYWIVGINSTTPAQEAQWIAYEVKEHTHTTFEPLNVNVHRCTACGHVAECIWNSETGKCEVCGNVCDHEGHWYYGVCGRCGKVCIHEGSSISNFSVEEVEYDVLLSCKEKNQVIPGITFEVICGTCDMQMTAEDSETVSVTATNNINIYTPPTCTGIGFYSFDVEITLYDGNNEKVETLTDTYDGARIIALGHTPVTDQAVAATCTTPGLTAGLHCSVCEEVLVAQEEIPALGHQWNTDGQCNVCHDECQHEWECFDDSHACLTCGLESYHEWECSDDSHACLTCGLESHHDWNLEECKCDRCNYECKHESLTCDGADLWVDDIEYEDLKLCIDDSDVLLPGLCFEVTCQTCRKSLTQDDSEIVRVTHTDINLDVEPTCEDEGSYSFKVKINLYKDGNEIKTIGNSEWALGHINPLGHAPVDRLVQAATCTEAGIIGTYCSRCDAELECRVEIAALGHCFDNLTLTEEPDEHGLYAYACDFGCGARSDHHIVADGKPFTTLVEFTMPSHQVSVARTFTASKPATVMLPFSINALLVQGATFSEFSGVSYDAEKKQWVATVTSVTTGNLQAYKPYIVVLDQNNVTGKIIFRYSYDDVATFVVTPEASAMQTADANGWTFKALNEAKSWAAGDPEIGKAYGFAGKDKDYDDYSVAKGEFVRIAAGASAKPGRCYLLKVGDQPGASNAPARVAADELPATIIVQFVNGETLGIGTLNTETGEMTLDGWYDLNGNKIEQPANGGIYIHNNKKVMVK